MSTAPLELAPSPLNLTYNGVSVPADNWQKARELMAQQVRINGVNLAFSITDRDGTHHGSYSIDREGTIAAIEPAHHKKNAELTLVEWAISTPSRKLISFPTLEKAFVHLQLVAEATKASIPITITGLNPNADSERVFSPTTVVTGEFETISTAELEKQMLEPHISREAEPVQEAPVIASVAHTAELTDETELEAVTPEETAEEDISSTTTVTNESVVSSDPEPEPDTEEIAEVPSTYRESTLAGLLTSDPHEEHYDDEDEPEGDKRKSFVSSVAATSSHLWNNQRKKVLIAGGSLLALLTISAAGIATVNVLSDNKPTTASVQSISDSNTDVPAGYSTTSAWSVPIPADAKVQGTTAAAIIIDGRTLTLYDNQTGQKIRGIVSDYPISTIDETTIDGKPAIIWLNEDKTRISAWHQGLGADGDIITEKLPAKSQVTRNGQMLTITASGKVYTLASDGLTEYTKPKDAELTPWSISEEGLLSIGYDVPLKVTNPSGETVRSIDLTAPEKDYSMQTWVAAGNGYAASIWSKDVNKAEADQPVKLVIHNLSDGSVSTVIDGTYSELAPSEKQMWKVGQGSTLASYGSYVFSLKDGSLVSQIDSSLSVLAPKGDFALGRSDAGNVYLFESHDEGYSLSGKYLLSQVPGMVITQKGGAMVAYPSSLT